MQVKYRLGSAEETDLPAQAFDIVTAGQCWHWFEQKPALAEIRRLLDSHGKLIEAWAGHKSFKPKDDKDSDGEDFHGTKRRNDTHESTTDPDKAERTASLKMLRKIAKKAKCRITAGADKAYDTREHVFDLRANGITPHVAA